MASRIPIKYCIVLVLFQLVVHTASQRSGGGQSGGGQRNGGGQRLSGSGQRNGNGQNGSGQRNGGGQNGSGQRNGGGQRSSQREGQVPNEPKLQFGGFEPIGQGKGLRFPGDKGKETKGASRPKKSQQKRPVDFIEEEYYDYDYPESSSDYYYYEDEEPLPSGTVTQEPPLPSGPTRRPGQATSAPSRTPVHPALNQFLNLPLLTTQRPRNLRKSTRRPQKQLNLGQRPGNGPIRVHSSLDIVDQTALFSSMDPHQEQFIPTPTLNAGALPLAFESDLPLSHFPPFNRKPRKEKEEKTT